MLYHLLYPLADVISVFNVFRYLSFRAIGAALTSLLLAFILGPILIRMLEERRVGQTIREDAPDRHQSKAGTPTMGGVLILVAMLGSALLWSEWTISYLWVVVCTTAAFGLIGFFDDYQKAIVGNPDGLRPRTKFMWQVFVATGAVVAMYMLPSFDAEISLPLFKDFHPSIGLAYIPFGVLVVVGFSNGVNLTDGLDGLAIGPTLTAAGVMGIFAYAAGHHGIAEYLEIKYVPGAGTLAVVCAGMMGAGLGFLWFNTYPASVIMGDTGALALGAALGTIAIVVRQEIVLAIAGGIFVVEVISVIVQVASFKLRGRRVFMMAPIHHHYELKGWPEPQIIVRFWIVSVILALLSLSLLKLR
jgi:phospho-N-acetylmuramoyl-pentapeptide-transferase